MMHLTINRMLESDIMPILKIQSENLRENLKPDQMKDGYLSIAFNENEFREFNRDLGVVVAKEREQVIGYCCVSGAAFNTRFPILDQIVANLPGYSVPGEEQRPKKTTTCFYGPVCIARPFRGQNVLTHLFSYGVKLSKDAGYSFCFSFISSENKRSLKAHLNLPFKKVGEVEYNDKQFFVMACKI